MDNTYDIAIVGAGIAGSALACALTASELSERKGRNLKIAFFLIYFSSSNPLTELTPVGFLISQEDKSLGATRLVPFKIPAGVLT